MKKQILLILVGLILSLSSYGQDVFVKRNDGDEIKSKFLENTTKTIKYKEYEFQDEPARNIKISEIFMTIYENGKKEKFNTTKNKNSSEVNKNESTNNGYKSNYFMLGYGFGNSYGGLGLRAQWRMGRKQGFGIHAGAGFFPHAPFLAAAGVKFFPYKDFYINTQFGLTGSVLEQHYNESGYFEYEDSHLLYGPSLLVGGDWNWGNIVGYGFNAGLGITYNINADNINAENNSSTTLALDLGFIIRF